MKLTVFGASGRIGGEIVRQGAAAGHDMTAVVRRGSAVTGLPEDARVVAVDAIDDPDVLAPAIAGRDAVLSGLVPCRLRVFRHLVMPAYPRPDRPTGAV